MRSTSRKPLALVVALALALMGTACSDDGDGGGDGDKVAEGPSEGGSWTVMHYSMADTDLEPFMMQDIEEMGQVGSGENLNIVALVDRHAEQTDVEVLDVGDWVGAKLLHIGEGTAEVLEEPGDLNLGDPATLAKFVGDTVKAYPADNYSLIISDHGGTWPGLGPDEGGGGFDLLNLTELQAGLEAGLEAGGIEKLGLLGMDACLMATYEVASALAPYADRLVASEEKEPGHGWDYRVLQSVHDREGATVDELGTVLVDGFKGQAEEQKQDAEITLSLIDLTKMAALDEAVAAFGTALTERGQEVAPVVGRQLADNLGFGKSPDPLQDLHSTDLGLLAGAIGTEALDVSDQADAVVKAVNDVIVHHVEGPSTEGASGLAIYFPSSAEVYSPEYANVSSSGPWNAYLTSYFGAGDAIPAEEIPQATSEGGAAETSFDENGLNIVGTFNAGSVENLTEAVIDYGLVEDDGSITYIGEEPAEIAEDGSVSGVYDLTVLKMTDGEDEAYAYISLTVEEGDETATIDVPMAYYAEGDQEGETYQDVLLSLTFDVESGDIIDETYYSWNEEAETYGELTADPEGIIVPELLNIAEDGTETWVPTSDVGLYADLPNIQYEFEPLEAGTQLQVELTVFDFGDNSDSVGARVEVPAA
ncbi:MAG TPA: clostripain-related cysteine peptidase [Acidimicrobiales bacterium]|nr:clostripain-related cysteine peptidase [Acidimicrobiales bacterium]